MRQAIGTEHDVQRFVTSALQAWKGVVSERSGRFNFDLTESPLAVREAVGNRDKFTARFQPNVGEDELYLARTGPIVEGLASHAMSVALDPALSRDGRSPASRCGVIRTKAVATRTTLLLVRLRYHILTTTNDVTHPLLSEDCRVFGFRGAPSKAEWLSPEEAEQLLEVAPDENVSDDAARNFLQKVLDDFEPLRPELDRLAIERGDELLKAHQRVRQAVRKTRVKYDIQSQLPPDVLGLYVYLPVVG